MRVSHNSSVGNTQKGKRSRYKFVGYVGYHHLWLNIFTSTVLTHCCLHAWNEFRFAKCFANRLTFFALKTRFVITLAFLVKSDLSFLVNSVTIISKMYLKLISSDTLKLMTEFGFKSFSDPGSWMLLDENNSNILD